MPSLIYSFVARGTTILVEYTAFSGNFATLAIQCLQKCPQANNSKFTYTCDRHTFNFLVADGFTFLCVAEEAAGRQLPFAFLNRIRDDFVAKHAPEAAGALTNGLDASFGPALKEHMSYCDANPQELCKVLAVQKQVEEVKSVMMENIEKVLDRGDRIELLVDKTEELRFQADNFYKTGRSLRRRMWWNNMKMKLAIAVLIFCIVFVIFLTACFWGGNNCFN
mmetsp:Transcript_29883/g.57412  ORF Transcript_29883/g.57412 Transcript_29883/m.57412 type:complete len:222 (-) Transcript_29883:364-1029(-)|eukprot:CAMPEP_0114249164 /NCGR_PEP_ID=MMETSP0058-20121206/13988_1 /TAXON_ID=36894 /ORGANISM="Pyramimonas parkeae, CCMP726" /LENGTH=221 /DNA_ID=CAMNT_0001362675 /DNA_START=188 /DNA_END=853 /DNA_ORIENTATION=+